MFTWGWTPYVDPDPMLSYFTTAEVTTDPGSPLANDANWCNAEYDELYLAQKQELDPAKRREMVQRMLRIFYDEAAYVVLFKYDDLMAIRADRWSGFEEARQPAKSGPALFNNTSPAYVMLKYKGGSTSGAGGAAWLGIGAAAVLGVTGVSLFVRRRRGAREDDRE
jgi:peptide/nickel transport system substrate-binding protein